MNKQLLEAVAEDDIERVKHLLAEGASANARNEYAETVLIRACWKKNKAMVQLLLKSGAAVNETDNVSI
jgi:ankyrin repeat protein